jgi:hypothetical protein
MHKQFVAHIRPELFCHVEERIQGYLLYPLVRRVSKGSICGRIIEVGNACGYGVSSQFRCVEMIAAVIARSDKFPAYGISSFSSKSRRRLL